MRMSVKRGLAVLLAAILMVPAETVMAVPVAESAIELENGQEAGNKSNIQKASDSNGTASNSNAEKAGTTTVKTVAEGSDSVVYNTGNFDVCVVNEDEAENTVGEFLVDVFQADGNYTIQIPELNPFFPYEVQFTYQGKTESRWFMTPDDTVMIGGHVFSVHADFDGTVVTQMNLRIGDNVIPVYPEAKKFTNNGGIMTMSLLPLDKKSFTASLEGFTPAELTRVSVDSVFTGEEQLEDTDKLIWSYSGDDYTINMRGDLLDLSVSTRYGGGSYEMIVGEDDQLAAENIRYMINMDVTRSENWLIPAVYTQDEAGKRTQVEVKDSDYYDSNLDGRWLYIGVSGKNIDRTAGTYIGLQINRELFETFNFDYFKVYEGQFTEAQKAEAEGVEITDQLFASDMTKENAGYVYQKSEWVTMLTFDAAGNVTGCLPFELSVLRKYNSLGFSSLYIKNGNSWKSVDRKTNTVTKDNCQYRTYTLEYGYAADDIYEMGLSYFDDGDEDNSLVTAAYVGRYQTIAEAQKTGANDIKSSLFETEIGKRYQADFSNGVYFSIFIGEDNSDKQQVYQYCVKTVEGEVDLSNSSAVNFSGLLDKDGNPVSCYKVSGSDDSYGDYWYSNYPVLLVAADTDLTELAPQFITAEGVNLYAEGSDAPESSGEKFHDFSNGPVHYTASAENKKGGMEYWLQVVKAKEGAGKLFLTSLADEGAKTKEENGVITSVREVFLNGYYDYHHDILIANIGTEPIPDLKAELVSDEVELDPYWTLKGNYNLSGFNAVSNGWGKLYDLENLAKIRLIPKEDAEDGRNVNGTLTIKSGDTVLMVLTLTGTVGDPGIVTKEIPEAVKYVHYGTMIQSNNKYSWNDVSFKFVEGKLPEGMVIEKNGEIYGVPKETGEFSFTVRMDNSYGAFGSSERTFTLKVIENTDENVDGATDEGYYLEQRIQDVLLSSNTDQTMVSEGIYGEFDNITLDGVKLTPGTDYTSESGSTRITIRSQTLKASNTPGTHTLSVEFRTGEAKTLKRSAQNYEVKQKGTGGTGSSSGSSSGGHSSKSSGNPKAVATSMIAQDAKKGFVHAIDGIITGTENGYSCWKQDEKGWWLEYADGTFAAGHRMIQSNGDEVEQILWEKINGSWYAFGADGYLKSGWVYDYQLGSWYCTTVESGMKNGWITDSPDGYTYYLEPEGGRLALGWKEIDDRWYYFNQVLGPRTWELDEETGSWYYNVKSTVKPFGALYKDSMTPDGFKVDENGAWIQ